MGRGSDVLFPFEYRGSFGGLGIFARRRDEVGRLPGASVLTGGGIRCGAGGRGENLVNAEAG